MLIRCVHVDYVVLFLHQVSDEVMLEVEVFRSFAADGVVGELDGSLTILADLDLMWLHARCDEQLHLLPK